MARRIAILNETGQITNFAIGQVGITPNSQFISDKSPLLVGDDYDQPLAWQDEFPDGFEVEIIINQVTGALPDFNDQDNEYTVNQGQPLTATADLNAPDEKFVVPFQRVDNGRVHNAVAELIGGVVSITVTFPTTGDYVLNSELLNSKRPYKIFKIQPQYFNVV